MVEYVDGSVLAQLGTPDMRIPIASTLAWPDRTPTPSTRLDFTAVKQLTFEAPDLARFPSIRLAREAVERGGVYPATLNAANEVAVASFLAGKLKFLEIAAVTETVLNEIGRRNGPSKLTSLDEAVLADQEARRLAQSAIASRAAA
jgi:1-deoxy-D-xylulose-5-phosphate reductoisomerase